MSDGYFTTEHLVHVDLLDKLARPLAKGSVFSPYVRDLPKPGEVYALNAGGFNITTAGRLHLARVATTGDRQGYINVEMDGRSHGLACRYSHVCGYRKDEVLIDWHAQDKDEGDAFDAWIVYF